VNAMLAAVLSAIAVSQMQMTPVPAAAIGIGAFLITAVILGYIGYRSQAMARLSGDLRHRVPESDRAG